MDTGRVTEPEVSVDFRPLPCYVVSLASASSTMTGAYRQQNGAGLMLAGAFPSAIAKYGQ